ncbi:MAG: hypothetical protein ACJAVV_002123 [Alphaproteobacteria bacterium]|jgi:hypothetical protein
MYVRLVKLTIVLIGLHVLAGCASSGSSDFFKQAPEKDYSNMYLRGVFNWWEVNEAFKLLPSTNDSRNDSYAVTIELIADGQPYDFKVADADWTMTLNCGNEFGAVAMRLSGSVDLVCASDSLNLQFTPSETAMYRFILDVSNNSEPELVIEKMD